jgi:DNA-binding NarL/FixJ family response regulator
MTGPKPVGRRWTPAEEKQLQDMLDAGKTADEIAVEIKRTRRAIHARLQRLYRKRAPSPAAVSKPGLKAKAK